eukprot:g5125.t1
MHRSRHWRLSKHFVASFRRISVLCQSGGDGQQIKSAASQNLSRRLRRAILDGQDTTTTITSERSSPSPISTKEAFNEDEIFEEMKSRENAPVEVRCFDTARIHVTSGSGGHGCVAFHREKFVSKGGPSGGNGGRGGHVWALADNNLNSLLGFRNKVHFRAGNGVHGKGSDLTGAQGEDAIVLVPPGTIIRYRDETNTNPPLAELVKPGYLVPLSQRILGAPGEECWLDLELKVVADVGIIGVPNAGKSTFLSAISAAKPKIANYPFTTLTPNLGVCGYDYETTVFADVPGMLEGASQGIGLGHEFLRHCMRCRALIHVIDGTSPDPLGDYEAIQLELKLFSPELASKPQIVCYNKMDIEDVQLLWEDVKQALVEKGIDDWRIFSMSAVAGNNTLQVVRAVRKVLSNLPEPTDTSSAALNLQQPPRSFQVAKIEDFEISVRTDITPRLYTIHGEAIEQFTNMTNWSYYESLRRFQRVLERSGVSEALIQEGIRQGDDVQIGERVFTWSDDNSEQELYRTFKLNQKAEGKSAKGTTRWPHST